MAKRNRANLQAGLLVEKALSSGMTLSDLSDKSEIGVSTLQRWLATGRGEAKLVRKVEQLVGPIESPPEELTGFIAEEYAKIENRKAFAIYDSDLYRVAGPLLDTDGYLEAVSEKLRLKGYLLLQTRKSGRVLHHVISISRINSITSGNIRDMKERWRETTDDSMYQECDEIG